MSYLSSVGRSLSTLALVTVGAAGGLLGFQAIADTRLDEQRSPIQLSQALPQDTDNAGLVMAIAVTAGAGLAVYTARNTARNRSQSARSPQAASLGQASGALQRKLLRLLHGDRQTATRLLNHAKLKYPDRSVNWCIEKVIYDLERDRTRSW